MGVQGSAFSVQGYGGQFLVFGFWFLVKRHRAGSRRSPSTYRGAECPMVTESFIEGRNKKCMKFVVKIHAKYFIFARVNLRK